MPYLEELLPEFRKGAKIRAVHWDKKMYFQYKDGNLTDHNNEVRDGFPLEKALSFEWELVKDPEPDWQYIIDNKYLCWFWDDKFNWAVCGTLGKIEKDAEYAFIMFDEGGNRSNYKHCRPVRRDEVTFYEDKRDE